MAPGPAVVGPDTYSVCCRARVHTCTHTVQVWGLVNVLLVRREEGRQASQEPDAGERDFGENKGEAAPKDSKESGTGPPEAMTARWCWGCGTCTAPSPGSSGLPAAVLLGGLFHPLEEE